MRIVGGLKRADRNEPRGRLDPRRKKASGVEEGGGEPSSGMPPTPQVLYARRAETQMNLADTDSPPRYRSVIHLKTHPRGLCLRVFAEVAQRQSTAFVKRGLRVQIP